MKSLPKIWGILAALGSLGVSVKTAVVTGDWSQVGYAFATVVALFSHSLPGDGPILPGKPKPPQP